MISSTNGREVRMVKRKVFQENIENTTSDDL